MATIWDVARLARVSKSTVSRALNGSPGVAPETARRVLEAARALRYRPNLVAQSLVKRRTQTIGLIIPDQRNPYYAQASWVAEREAGLHDYLVMVCNSDNDPRKEEEYLRVLEARQVDGILLIGGVKSVAPVVRMAAQSSIPVVLVDRAVGSTYPIPSVVLDNIRGGRELTEFLLNLGHLRIAFVTSEYTMAERDRRIGYERALEAAGLPVDPELVVRLEEATWKDGRLARLEQLLKSESRPTAIFASNDLKAIAVYRLLRRMGLRVPEDISVVGYDNIEIADLLTPPLTTMAQPIDDMAATGMRILLQLIEGGDPPSEPIRFAPRLHVRASTARVGPSSA